MKETLHLRKNQVFHGKYCCWKSRSKFSNLKIKKLQEERKAQLNVIERLTENQNNDFRKKTRNDLTTVRPNKNSKGLSSRQNTVPEHQNKDLSSGQNTVPDL